MNEQAIIDSYNTFVSNGYTKSLNEFKKLIASNPQALQDSYSTFQGVGYKKSIDEYKVLMGVSSAPTPPPVAQPVVEKKSPSVTTGLPVAASSSASPLPPTKAPKEDDGGILSSIGKGIETATGYVSGLAAESEKSVLSFADDIVTGAKKLFEERNPNIVKQENLNPSDSDYQKKLGEQLKAKIATTKTDTFSPLNPLDVIGVVGKVLENKTKQVINSTLSQEQKNAVIKKLNEASDRTKYEIYKREKLQEETLDDGITTTVLKGIAGFVPDLAAAALMKNPTVLESRYAATTARILPTIQKISPKAAVVIEKYAPKVAKFTEEAVTAPMTKIFTVKGAIGGVANAKDDETLLEAGTKGAGQGFFEGIYMHGLGYVAGKTSPVIAKAISKTGMNSAISTAIANPLANAGVFATAKAIRTPIQEGRLATEKELATEMMTGVGFSLLHAGSMYKNHKELNHYYDNTLKENELGSFGRAINETKANLELVYDPNLTPEQIAEIKEARDELKKAAILEPDLKKKIELGNEALKLQNKLDANFTVKAIIENKNKIVDEINSQEDLTDEQKSFFTKKINAIADNFDNSEVGLKKKELNTKIGETQKTLSNLSEKFTNQTLPSDRAETKLEIDTKTKEFEDLNNELNELVKMQKETKVEEAPKTEEPTQQQLFDDIKNNRFTTANFNSESEIPNIWKDKVRSTEINPDGTTVYRITLPTTQFEYEIETGTSKVITDYPTETKKQENAVQKQSTEQPQLGLQEVVEGNVTTEGKQEVTPEKLNVDNSVVISGTDGGFTVIDNSNKGNEKSGTSIDVRRRQSDEKYEVIPAEGDTQRTLFQDIEFNDGKSYHYRIKDKKTGEVFYIVGVSNRVKEGDLDNERNGSLFASVKDDGNLPSNIRTLLELKLIDKFDERSKNRSNVFKPLPESFISQVNDRNNTELSALEKNKTATPEVTPTVTPEVVNVELKPIEATPETAPEVVSEVTFEGKRGQADSITFDGKTIKQGEEIDLNDVNISQDDTIPDLRSGKYKVRMLSVDANGKTATLTLTDGNEVITTTVKDLRNSESKKAFSTPEGKPKTAHEKATEERKKAKATLKSLKQGMGISPDAKLEALVKYHKALVKEAKEYIKEKGENIEAWAKSIGDRVTKITQTAWDEATGKIKNPIEKGEDLDYTFEETFGDDIEELPKYEETMENVEYKADEAYKSINYLKEVLKNAQEKYEKYKELNKEDRNPKTEQRLKDRVEKAKAELEEYEGYFEESKNKAIEILKESKLYKNATDIQKELLVRDVESRFGEKQKKAPSVEKILGKKPQEKTVLMTEKEALIKQLKDLSRGGKDATKTIKEVTTNIAKTLKDLQTKGELTVLQVNRILGKLAKVNMLKEESVNKFIDDITEVFEDAQEAKTEKDKKTIINKILDLVNKKAKTKILSSGKRRSRGLDADGQLFFQSVREVLNAAAANDTNKMMDIMNKLASRQTEIDDAVLKEMRGEALTLDETILLNEVMAFDMFPDILDKSVSEIQDIYDSLKDVRAESINRLKDKRLESAAKKASMELDANDNIQEGFGSLFNADGTLKDKNKLDQDHDNIYDAFKKLKIWDGIKKYIERHDFNNKNFITNFFRNKIANVGTISNILDKTGSLFKDNVYDKLNNMNEKKLVGIEAQTKILNTLANKIFGNKKNGYQKFKFELAGKGTKDVILNGDKYIFNHGQLLRIYALSLNRVQRNKLNDMGFTEAKILKIKEDLGPEFVEFADKIVEYLSTDYFGTVNDVYRKVNDVNLNQIENYFPTKTVSKEANADLLQKGDFNGIFNAETSPAFKERLDKTSPIDLKPSFTDVLDNHLQTMEMYKSHAEGVKEMNTFFNIQSVKTLLDQTGLGPVLKFNVNNSISPNAGAPIKAKGMDKIINSFTPFALAFKTMQFVKQATSIGAAYGDYSFRANKKTFLLDLPFWIADVAKVIATPRASIKKFKNISATFKERYDSGLAGDIASMETAGRTFLPSSQKNTLLGKFRRGFKSAAGFTTFAGDILSTFGYMANYNRDIKNGMNPEKALEKFNDYNATLQTKRPSEKSAIQHNQDFIARTVTMFGSSGLLMMNTVSQSTKNILRSVSNKEAPKIKDIRKLVFAVGVGNALFIAASNAFKLMSGDDEDKEEAKEDIFEALIGLNLIEQIPLLGDAVELAKSKIKGERFYESSGTNPFLQLGKKMYKIYEEEEGNIVKALRPIAEMKLGFQFEPFMGIVKSVAEGEVDEDNMYDMLGVAKSYRPTGEEEQEARAEKKEEEEEDISNEVGALRELIRNPESPAILSEALDRIEYLEMTKDEKKEYKKKRKNELQEEKDEIESLLQEYDSKDDMRRYDKDLYEKTFGKGSSYYNRNEAKSKMEEKVMELQQKQEDTKRGYVKPVKEKKIRRNKDGSIRKSYKRKKD